MTTGFGASPDASGGFPALEDAPELSPPIEIVAPPVLSSPLVLSSPHSGHIYPAKFLAMSRLHPAALRRSEDTFVDELMRPATEHGAPLLRALFPRAFLDVNREPYELDPRMFEGRLPPHVNTRSMRVAGGLGTIARVVGDSQEIYARRLPVAAAFARIEALYKPYHRALRDLLARAVERFGVGLVVDCHSMPSISAATGVLEDMKADIVLGDRHGTSCDPDFVAALDEALRAAGYGVRRNKPYAGGYITEHYGRPGNRMHAVQIEINRALYMDETTFAQKPAFARLAADLSRAVEALADYALARRQYRAAAE
jgi:N-formylglutamate deformylase